MEFNSAFKELISLLLGIYEY